MSGDDDFSGLEFDGQKLSSGVAVTGGEAIVPLRYCTPSPSATVVKSGVAALSITMRSHREYTISYPVRPHHTQQRQLRIGDLDDTAPILM